MRHQRPSVGAVSGSGARGAFGLGAHEPEPLKLKRVRFVGVWLDAKRARMPTKHVEAGHALTVLVLGHLRARHAGGSRNLRLASFSAESGEPLTERQWTPPVAFLATVPCRRIGDKCADRNCRLRLWEGRRLPNSFRKLCVDELEKSDISQSELARRLGRDRRWVSKVVSGQIEELDVATADQWMAIFGKSIQVDVIESGKTQLTSAQRKTLDSITDSIGMLSEHDCLVLGAMVRALLENVKNV